MREWTDDEGHRAAILEGGVIPHRLSIWGKPSVSKDDGTVAVGVDLPKGSRILLPTGKQVRYVFENGVDANAQDYSYDVEDGGMAHIAECNAAMEGGPPIA